MGKCISEKYVNNNLPLIWECENGHKFHTSLAHVKNEGTWCRECKKLGLEFAQNLANKKGGTCLSSSYYNKCTPLSWSCSKGHSWLARISSIQRGTWCPYCMRESERLGIEHAKALAHSKNGECLSNIYINRGSYLRWRCSKLHEWDTSLANIKYKNSWCPYCSGARLDISVAKSIAQNRGGECLTDFYVNIKSKLLWKCNKNYQWYAILPIKKMIIHGALTIRRPNFLKTAEYSTGLELDIYYPQYGFAIEVQGEQHKRYIKHFHQTLQGFNKQLIRDQLKAELCEENWIVLRYVWYYEDPYIIIPEYLREL
ncbi:2017_t:CDS:2, partial [Gigaspora margarita]